MSLNEIKKEFQTAGKGHNVIFVIAILMEHTPVVTDAVKDHVPDNGGTCIHNFGSVIGEHEWKVTQAQWLTFFVMEWFLVLADFLQDSSN
jgi:hypothetical protein